MISERVQNLLVRARNAFRLRDYETADLLVDEMLEEYPESIAGHILKGIILGRTAKNQEAIKVFRRALELDPVNAEAFNNIAVSLRQEGRLHQALRAVQKAEELFGGRADILYNKGNILKDLGQIDEAIAAYHHALEADDRYVLAYNNLGTLFQGRGDLNRAIETFSMGLSIDPNHPTLRYNLGLAYEDGHRLEDAEAEYRRSLTSRPGWGEALNNLGIVYQKQERYQEAERTFREILHINRHDPRANNNLATNFALQGRTRDAMQFYRQALQSDPSYSRAAGNLGQLIDHQRDMGDAVDELQQLADLDSDNIDLQYRLARALSRTDRHVAAERVLERILELDPRHLEATRLLADVYLRSGHDEKAEKCYLRLKTLNADFVGHHLDRAHVFLLRGDPATALREVDLYLETMAGDLGGLMVKASVLAELGRQDEAVEMLDELRKLYPGDGRILAAIAGAHQRGGDREEAIRAVDELINLQGSRATPEDIEALNESLELYEKAVEAFAEENRTGWELTLNRLGELSRPEEPEVDQALESDENVSLDEDSIPILSFGGEELLEPDEWDVQVRDDEVDDQEDEFLGIAPAQQLAPSLVSLPEEQYRRGGESFAEGFRSPFGGGMPSSPALAPPSQATTPAAPAPSPDSPAGSRAEPSFPGRPAPPAPPQQPSPPPSHSQTSTLAPPAPEPPAPAPPPADVPSDDEYSRPPASESPSPYPEPRPAATEPETLQPEDADLVELPEDFELIEDDSFSPAEQLPELEFGEESELEDEYGDELDDSESYGSPLDEGFGYEEDVPTIDDLLGDADEPAADEFLAEALSAGRPEEDDGATESSPAGLLDYLSGMVSSLPPPKRSEYMASEERLRLEYLRAKLSGRRGLHSEGERYASSASAGVGVPLTRKRLRDTLAYIGSMSTYHPDSGIGTALKHRVGIVLEHLRELRETSEYREPAHHE